MKKILILSVFICLIENGLRAQDATFLNNNQSFIYLNPSFAGSNGAWRFQSNYSSVNPQLSYVNRINYTSVDAYIKPIHGAFALSFLHDDYMKGLLVDNRINLAYAQHFSLGESKVKLIPSIEFTYIKRHLDVKSLTYTDPSWIIFYPSYPASYKRNLDISTGLLLSYKSFNGGIAIKHLTQPDIGVYGKEKLPASLNIHSSYTKSFGEKSLVQFFALFNHQGSMNSIGASVNAILMKHLILGASFNTKPQGSVSIGYRNNYVTTLFGYGSSFIKLVGSNSNIFNVSLGISLYKKDEKASIKNFENW